MKILDGTLNQNIHFKWRPDNKWVIRVDPGEQFQVVLPDSSTNQIKSTFTVEDLKTIDESKFDAATGPVYVNGAVPGDTVEVILDDIEPGDWGWTAILSNFGLLKGVFKETLVIWDIADGRAQARGGFLRGISIPVRPFLGVIGCAPSEGEYGMIPPQHFGGNMDNRLLKKGAQLFLPVQKEGGLISFSDPHAAQGDGEVCGTAIETSAKASVRIKLHKDMHIKRPMLISHVEDSGPVLATMGISNDLYQASKDALLDAINQLKTRGLTGEEAYVLCSVAGNLKISEIVDEPNYVVSLTIPLTLLEKR
ncbi:MAG: acetamidase/formamidase family protein [Thermoprotei archaeon]